MRLAIQLVLLAAIASALAAQSVGSARGQDFGGYNVVNSFETGYRFSSIDGDLGKYRSDVNLRNGVRLLGSNLSVHSKDGKGRMFDELVLQTLGLGNDPYESSLLRLQKNRWYRYDMLWRMNEYFNPGIAIANGRHLLDTRRRLQDHDLTLLPQSKFKFRLGYTRNSQDGPALSTIQLFDGRGDEFPLFANVRRERNEYRVGGDFEFVGIKLHWLQGWDYFKEDTAESLGAPNAGNNPSDRTTLASLYRAQPYHGSTPFSRLNLRTERKYFAVNGRLTYAGGRRGFLLDESSIGTNRLGAAQNRQIVVGGNARRPVTTGDFSLAILPTARLSVTNATSISSTRIDGDAVYREFSNATLQGSTLQFRFLGIHTVANMTDAQYRISDRLWLYTGYHFSFREIRSIESEGDPRFGLAVTPGAQENRQHTGLFGLRAKPLKPVTVTLDGEVGRADTPFFPVSDRNYHALGGRIQVKQKTVLLSAAYREKYNTNSVSFSSHSSRARNYSFDASWALKTALSLDASYSKMHLDTVSGIAFFGAGALAANNSYYVSNLHSLHLAARVAVHKRAELHGGYMLTKDTGGSKFALRGSVQEVALLSPAQSFPLSFQSPLARVSVLLRPKLRWNFSWQYYRYSENPALAAFRRSGEYYRAHTGYTSLLWAF
jgi:hypothetical protein